MAWRLSSITQRIDQHSLCALKNAQIWRPFRVANGGVDHCQLNDVLQVDSQMEAFHFFCLTLQRYFLKGEDGYFLSHITTLKIGRLFVEYKQKLVLKF